MSTDITNIGIGSLTEEELEELALLVEDHLLSFLDQSSFSHILTDYSIIVSLSQSSNNLLTLTLDFSTAGAFSPQKLKDLHEELYILAQNTLKEALLCRKNS